MAKDGKTNLEIMRDRKMRFQPRPRPTMMVTTADGQEMRINKKDFDPEIHIDMAAPKRVRVTDGLDELSLKDLKTLAEEEGVETNGLRKKSDFAQAIRDERADDSDDE